MDTEDALVAALEAGTLDPAAFDHAAHVRVGWAYLRRAPVERAIPAFAETLQRFARGIGKPGLYHATITWAFLLLIHERMARLAPDADFATFREQNPDLFRKDVLRRWYLDQTLGSDLARAVFVMPDRLRDGEGTD
ncbi:MAG: hypothetical protein ABMB14_34785 [Myxococcota bacterium]